MKGLRPVFNTSRKQSQLLATRDKKLVLNELTLFFPIFPFDPPEKIRKPSVFLYSRGNQKGTLGSKRLIKFNPFHDTGLFIYPQGV